MPSLAVLLCFPFVFAIVLKSAACDYWQDREQLLKEEDDLSVGGSLVLSQKELKANDIIMNYKTREYDAGFQNPDLFLPAHHFFKTKKDIERTKTFNIIQRLPKGASLHSHDIVMVSQEFLFNLTYSEGLYGCITDNKIQLKFFRTDPADSSWKSLTWYRQNNPTFDDYLYSQLSLIVDNPEEQYPDLNDAWKSFEVIVGTVLSMVTYKPVFQEYFYQVLKELAEDNVMYLEFRGLLPEVYDLDDNKLGPVDVLGLYYETTQQFVKDYPDFHGVRFIYAPERRVSNKTVEEYVHIYRELKNAYPNFVAGFDLVGQEDLGHPLSNFIPELLTLANDTKFFFHAGETAWNGESTDLNLVDAVLLNASRIGHAYAVSKHPKVAEAIKQKDIAIEISPISNQVLRLVNDIRNHPGSNLIAAGYPVVICSDDPGAWGAKGLSYDWYYAFMGLSSKRSDIKLLKQLAMNSINYSAMEDEEKDIAMDKWQEKWDEFLTELLEEYMLQKRRPNIKSNDV